jgi:hypothetical protein
LAPELNIPVANDRSFLGKYSAVTLIAAGKLPASPNASNAREKINPTTDTGTAAIPIPPRRFTRNSQMGIASA